MNVTELIERLRDIKPLIHGEDLDAAADALEAQARTIDELRNALACELDDTRNACGVLNEEIARLQSRLAAAERALDDAYALLTEDEMFNTPYWHECRARLVERLAKLEAKP